MNLKITDHLIQEQLKQITRRHFLQNLSTGIGGIAAASILGGCSTFFDKKGNPTQISNNPMEPSVSHFRAKAKKIIYMHMAGAPSQIELFDYKPELYKLNGKECPPSLLEGKKFAFINGKPNMLGPIASFNQYGNSGAWVSNHLPNFSRAVDEVCFIKSMHTNEFNHAPAQLFMHTGSPRMGRPAIGAWVTYGLGSENENLPGFIVLASGGKTPDAGKSIWGSGFLPSVYQGVQCRSEGDPVLYVSDPHNQDRTIKGDIINTINEINKEHLAEYNDPEINTRIAQYEMAYKMQISVPEVMDISKEPAYIHQMYGTQPGKSSFANNCLLARRLVEQGVRYVQLFHWGWDSHGADDFTSLTGGFVERCKEIDQAMTALLEDLKQRGLLEETLIVWGGEFGRTPIREIRPGANPKNIGRDHNPDAFTVWMAGAGVKAGYTHGETDEISFNVIKDKVHVHDFQATILHLLGMNHEQLTYFYQGRDFRLTDVHGQIVKQVLS
ncbi:MAG: DUF1501 domain-containing protein [Cytophagales bacterium]|nr:MAG: DUF1501 domain-containing protein [Cytophagales bacterium]